MYICFTFVREFVECVSHVGVMRCANSHQLSPRFNLCWDDGDVSGRCSITFSQLPVGVLEKGISLLLTSRND